MAAITPEILNKVHLFAGELSRSIKVEKIYVFGSHARGTARAESDIDILVVSDDFKNTSPLQTGFLLFRAAAKIPGDLQPLGYTLDEYRNHHSNLFLREVLADSVEVSLP